MCFTDIQMEDTPPLAHHKGRDIGRSLTRQILREIEISPDEFIDLLNKKKIAPPKQIQTLSGQCKLTTLLYVNTDSRSECL